MKNKILTNDLYQKMKNNDKNIFWTNISRDYILSEDIIREFKDRVVWGYISTLQILSESFIREFKDYVWWTGISEYQNMSYEFIIEFIDKFIVIFLKDNKYLKQNLTESQWKTIEFLKRVTD